MVKGKNHVIASLNYDMSNNREFVDLYDEIAQRFTRILEEYLDIKIEFKNQSHDDLPPFFVEECKAFYADKSQPNKGD